MTLSFPINDTFENHFREMLSIMRPPQTLHWSRVLVVEEQSISWGKPSRIERSALFTPEAYESKFDELLNQWHVWVNMSTMGVLDDTLLVEIEYPHYKNDAPRNKLFVNYSQSIDENWDLSNRFEIIEDK